MDPPQESYHKLAFLRQSIEPIFTEGVTCSQSIEAIFMESITSTLQRIFDVVTSNLYLAYLVPQRDLCVVCCTQGSKLIITRKVFTNMCCA